MAVGLLQKFFWNFHYIHCICTQLQQSLSAMSHLIFGFLLDVDDVAAKRFANTAAVSRSAVVTVLMSKLISCGQREMT